MKRSRAEEIINNWLDTSTEITGKTIIDVVQELGMKPPEIKEFVETPSHNIIGAGFKVAHNVSKWEEE